MSATPPFRKPSFLASVVIKPTSPAHFDRMAASPPQKATPKQSFAHEPADEAVSPHDGADDAPKAEAPRPPPPPPAFLPDGVAERLASAIDALKLQNGKLADQAKADALEIGLIVAERILEQEISTNPRALLSLIRSAMRRLAESRSLSVALCPADFERVQAKLTEGGPDVSGLTGIKLEVDPALQVGDCRVQSELGVVDGRLANRLAEIRRSIEQGEAA